jgi:hypothetical protein
MSVLGELLRGAERPPVYVRYRVWHDHARADVARRASDDELGEVHRIGIPAAELPPSEIELSIWRLGDRLRVEHAGGVHDGAFGIALGDRWWSWSPRDGGTRRSDQYPADAAWIGRGADRFLDPPGLAEVLRLEPRGPGTRAGRRVLIADAWAGSNGSARRSGLNTLGPHADRYRVEVDAERGLVLSVHAFFAAEAYQTIDAIDLQIDGPVDERLFEFRKPPDNIAQDNS